MSPSQRHRRREAVFGAAPRPDAGRPERGLSGIVLDASPHLLVLHADGAEVRLAMSESTAVWHGGRGGLAALRPGRPVVVRRSSSVAEKVWVGIGRVGARSWRAGGTPWRWTWAPTGGAPMW